MDNPLKSNIKRIISFHEGKQSAITRRELLHALELKPSQDRKVRELISELRHEGIPILFSTGDKHSPGGYYMPRNLRELREGIDKMKSYVVDECQIMAAWKKYGYRYLFREVQTKLPEA